MSPPRRRRRDLGDYATPAFVAGFIADAILGITPDAQSVFDPCIGAGGMTDALAERGLSVAGMDIAAEKPERCEAFTRGDFLAFFGDRVRGGDPTPLPHGCLVANPPYNCHESDYVRSNAAWLRPLFSDVGIANVYGMFLAAMIRLAKPGAVLGVLTFDSLLTARFHDRLRRLILERCAVHAVILCPRDLFYRQSADARTCVLILRKDSPQPAAVRTLDRPADTPAFKQLLREGAWRDRPLRELLLSGPMDRSEFVVGCPPGLRRLFDGPRLGQRFRCLTGLSTGDDGRYLRRQPEPGYSVPFCKNPAHRRFWAEPDAYLTDDYQRLAQERLTFRLRNPGAIRHHGIACSSMGVRFGAVYRPAGRVFGVNANIPCQGPADLADLWWLLAYLNSGLTTYLIRGALLRTNMVTSGYVRRLPLPEFDEPSRRSLGDLARRIVQRRAPRVQHKRALERIDQTVGDGLSLDEQTRRFLSGFRDDLLRRA